MSNPFRIMLSLTTTPFRTFRRSTLSNPVFPALFILLGSVASLLLTLWSEHHEIYSANLSAFSAVIPFFIAIFLIGTILFTAIWHFSADILGGAGRGLTLQYFVFLAYLPLWLTGPIAFLLKVVVKKPASYPIVFCILVCWTAFLLIAAMKELYRFTFLKALLNLILSPALLTAIAWIIYTYLPENIFIPV